MTGRRWIWFVILLLAGHVTAMTVLAATAGDPASRIVPDYYRKAVDWDRSAEAHQASRRLGWIATPRLISIGSGRARLDVVVRDRDGHPVRGATARADLRHQSRATGLTAIALSEVEPGHYIAVVDAPHRGIYVAALSLARGDDRWIDDATVERDDATLGRDDAAREAAP